MPTRPPSPWIRAVWKQSSKNYGPPQQAARKWVNKRVAHLDPNAPKDRVTFDDLENGMNGLRKALTFVFPLFNRGSTLATVTPSTPASWMQTFSEPWYVPESGFVPVTAFDLG